MNNLTLTKEQNHILSSITPESKGLSIFALAGSGKTFILKKIGNKLQSFPSPKDRQTLALAFNKDIANTLADAIPSAIVKTFNGLGHGVWKKAINKPRLKVNMKKSWENVNTVLEDYPDLAGTEGFPQATKSVYDAMKTLGWFSPSMQKTIKPRGISYCDSQQAILSLASASPDFEPETLFQIAEEALGLSIKDGFVGDIDFGDQIYLPCVFNASFPFFTNILVDEAQDLNPLNHIMISKLTRKQSRLFVCGDPLQSIYGFRGAQVTGLEDLTEKFSLPIFTLSTTFRCGKLIAKEAQDWAKDITTLPDQHEGHVSTLPDWNTEFFTKVRPPIVLCPHNAPLMKLGFALFREGFAPTFSNHFEIQKRVTTTFNSIVPRSLRHNLPLDNFLEMLTKWAGKQRKKLKAQKRDNELARVEDMVQIFEVLHTEAEEQNQFLASSLLDNVKALFNPSSGKGIHLSTIHKAKGQEWGKVVLLGMEILPTSKAVKAHSEGNSAMYNQQRNLKYVAQTRAIENLYYLPLD